MIDIFIGALLLILLMLALTLGLHYLHRKFPAQTNNAIAQVEAILPQTQCAQCGYPGCKPYARAIIENNAPINLCPPGGDAGIRSLAQLLNRPYISFEENNSANNNQANLNKPIPMLAKIREAECIGCLKCIQACPVDAIIGAPKLMHSVINDYCTGCQLCLPPCPMDCIDMIPARSPIQQWQWPKP
jgi:electron transport complex protein RnfB